MDGDLSGGYPAFEQLEPQVNIIINFVLFSLSVCFVLSGAAQGSALM